MVSRYNIYAQDLYESSNVFIHFHISGIMKVVIVTTKRWIRDHSFLFGYVDVLSCSHNRISTTCYEKKLQNELHHKKGNKVQEIRLGYYES